MPHVSQQQIKSQPVAKKGMSVAAYRHMDGPLSGNLLPERPSPRLLTPGSSQPNTHLLQVSHLPPALQAGGVRRYSPISVSSASADVLSFGAHSNDTPPRRSAENHYGVGEGAQS